MARFRNRDAIFRAAFAIALSVLLSACAASQPPPPPPPPPPAPVAQPQPTPTPEIVGMASWYGPGFHGRHTSTGRIYDQEELTAASNVFPLGSRVMVTNLDNGRSVEVTVTDHGPFKKGRKIDLSHKAARIIGMLDQGTARVRISLITKPAGSREVGSSLQYFVQLGSFTDESNANALRDKLAASYPDVHIQQLDAERHHYYRVRMGAFASRSDAEARAADLARFQLPIVIVTE